MKTILPIVAVLAMTFSGCATAPEWERNFGDAARQTRAAQTLDPNASSRNTALAPTDGKAAAGAMTKYAESHGYAVKEGKQPVLVLSTGSR
jgi:PBP1b-binding outer membrane lipoprotein LpoB